MARSKEFTRYTVTAALPYTNGPIHIGHLAGVYVPADIYVRYLRLIGKDVIFVCGSDEHGVAISMQARKEGVIPQQIIDRYHPMIKKSFEEFGIAFTNYSRTSAPVHFKTASDFFLKLYEQGDFLEEETEQLYDPEAKQFLADRFVIGTCPKCNYPEAYGDQCENCGTSLNATDLIDPKSTLTNAVPILKKTKHWFLPLNHYEEFLKDWIVKGHKNDWKPNVYGQCKSWIDEGLKPRAVTRDLDWGIPVPLKDAKGKVLYVWFDAPIGYISSTKEWASRENKNWEPYWKDENTKLVHFIGKDNIVFHCIIFPSILKAHGDYILPNNVPANEFLNLEGHKLSTSKNWAVWLDQYMIDFPDMQDVLRYTLTANAPETKDNDFTWKDFQARNNNELVAIFGNFINRVVVLTHKYYNGVIPNPSNVLPEDETAMVNLGAYPDTLSESLERYRFREASQELMKLARLGNRYLAEQEPWKLIKENPERVQTIIYTALQIAAGLAVLCEPFLPFTATKLKSILNFKALDSPLSWKNLAGLSFLLPDGHQINEASLLFRKIEDSEVNAQLQKLEAVKKENASKQIQIMPQKEIISFEDFAKLDLRVGTILEAKKMPKTDKLLVLLVDTGIDKRTIVSGIAESYSPEEIVGQKVSVLVNLEPRKLRGVESQGMILMAESEDGKLAFINPSTDELTNGNLIN